MTAPADDEQNIPVRRKWMAILSATLLSLFSYWMITLALVVSTVDEASRASGAAIAIGLALVPFVFIVAAFVSKNPTASMGILKAMGLFILIALILNGVGSPAGGMVGGFGAGAVVTIRAEEPSWWRPRAVAIAAVTIYIVVLERFVPQAAVFAGGFFPFVMIGFADAYSIWRESRDGSASSADTS